MLSRIAESLYWIGRYTERAEDTARLLDVHYHHLLEDRWADEATACAGLLAAMGDDPDDLIAASDADGVTAFLVVRHRRTRRRSRRRSKRRGRTRAARGRRSRRRCGSAQHDAPHAAGAGSARRGPHAARLLPLGAGARRDARRARRLDAEPRRRLVVPRARPQPRTGRHDRPAALGPLRARRGARRCGPRRCGAARPTRRTCARTATASTRPRRSSSCCSTGCSRARCSTRSPPRSARSASSTRGPAAPASTTRPAASSAGAHAELSFLRVSDAAADLPELLDNLQAATARGAQRGHAPLLPGHPRDRVERLMSGWRLRVRHHTGYRYASDVHASYNEARLTPAGHRHQSSSSTASTCSRARRSPVPRLLGHLGPHVRPQPRRTASSRSSGYSVVETGKRMVATGGASCRGRTSARPWCRTRWCEYLGYTNYTAARRRDPRRRRQLRQRGDSTGRGRGRRRVDPRRHGVREGLDDRDHDGARGAAGPPGRVPGLRAPRARTGAEPRHPGPLHVGVPAPVRRRA